MSNEIKSMAFTCESGQTVLIGQDIRLTVEQIFKAKNGRPCLKLLVKVPKNLEVFQTKRSFEEMASLNGQSSTDADLLKIIKNALKSSAKQDVFKDASEATDLSKILTIKRKRKVYAASTESDLAQGCSEEKS